nr:Ig-like domain-containing protein [Azospirillum sp. 412522]
MRDVLIADASLDDLDLLLDRCRPDVRIVRVAADEDGGEALADALAGRPAAIHLLAHGEPGVVRLGARRLDVTALSHSWPQAPDTEILIHACDTGADGGRFAAALAQATGARVAAASHPVGHPSLGASWELDVTTGPVAAALPVSDTGAWVHRLAYTGTPGDGDDTLIGDDTGNTINGGAGNDSIVGGTGNDSLVGGLGDDTLVGGGNTGQAAGDTLNGGLGADHYVGGNGFTIVTYENATTGITLDLTDGANNTGEAAGDTFVDIQRWVGSEHADSLTAGDTAVWFWGHGGNDIEHGGAGNDTLEAGDGNDTVFGGGGNDLIYGRADNDELHGDAGNDTVAGGGGADLIYGDAGNDLLKGDWERDTIHGGDGDDTILAGIVSAGSYGQAQADQIFGEAGNDRYIVVNQYDAGTVSFDGGEGTDTLEIRSDDLTSYNGYDLEYYTDVASPAIDLTGMTLTGVERLELTGSKAHDVTMTGAQAAGFEVIAGGTASDTLRIAGSADLSAVAMSGIEAIEVMGGATGGNATLTLAASQLAGLALTGNGNALVVTASGTGATVDLSGATGFGQVGLTGTAGADDLTVGAGATVTGNGGDDVIRIAAGTTGTVTIADAAVGDRLVMTGADLTTMQIETGAASTILRVGSDLAVTLTGSFAASQFQVGSGGSVTIVQANNAPVAEAGKTVMAQAGAAVALGIAAPTDADGDTLTVTVTGLPAGGTIQLADGTAVTANQSLTLAQLAALTFTAAAGTVGDAGSFAYTVSDGHGGTAGQSVALTVNAAPVAEADKAVMAQAGAPVALGIAVPTDANGDTLSVTVTGLPAGGAIQLADGTAVTANQTLTAAQLSALTFTAAAGTVGDAGSFAYTVSDGHGGTAGQSVALTVNAAPVAETDKAVMAQAGAPVALGIAAPTDANGDTLSVTVTGLPAGGAIQLADGTAVTANQTLTAAQLSALTFTAAAGTVGDAGAFTYTVSDGHGGTTGQSVALMVNAAPVTEADRTVTAQVGGTAALSIAAPTDANGDTLSVTVTGLPTGGTIQLADGTAVAANQTLTTAQLATLTFTPAAGTVGDAGSFAYTVSDGHGGTAGQSVALTVNAAPVAEADKAVMAQANAPIALGIAAPTDANGDTLSVTVTGLPAGGAIQLADGTAVTANQTLTTAQLAALTFTAAAGTVGDAGAFTYTVSDGHGGTAGQSVALTVNAAPVAETDKAVMAQANAPVALGIAAPTDANGDMLSVTVTGLPAGGAIQLADGTAVTANQSLTLAQLAALTFTAAAGTVGDAGSFAYTVSDGHGGTTGQSVALMVNAAPVTEADRTVTAQVGGTAALSIAAPTDANGDTLSVTVTGLPTGGTIQLADGTAVAANQTLTTAQLATLTFTPAAGTVGDAGSFAYTVSDGHGGTAGQSVALTVNAAPVAEADKAVMAQANAPVALGIAVPTDANGDTLSVTVTGLPAGGAIQLADGTAVTANQTLTTAQLAALTFTAAAGTVGDAGAFAYTVSDGHGGTAGQSVALTVNAAPVTEADKTVTARQDAGPVALGIAAPTDANGDALSVTVTGLPTGGALTLADGTVVTANQTLTTAQLAALTFTPAAGTIGDAGSFAYRVEDGHGGVDTQTIGLTVEAAPVVSPPPPPPPPVTSSPEPVVEPAVNSAPVVQADKTVNAQDRTAVSLGIAAPTDSDGDPLTVTVTGLPGGGIVRMADGSAVTVNQTLTAADLPALTFLAADGMAGDAGAFAYRVDDGHGGIAAQSIALQVIPSADPASTTPQAPAAGGLPAGFNALAYIASYPDLMAAFGTNTEAATQHYLQAGQAEGRTVTFDPLAYTASYPDLISAFGIDANAAAQHYIQFGYSEGRHPDFNGLAYIASYPDLSAAFGTNADAGTRHYIQSGYAEGRSVTFDGYNYLAANPDVALAYGVDANAAARHYIEHGQAEGRPAQGFDALRYIASNPDLIQALGPDVQAAEIHYVQFGRNEGRSLTAFDPAAYLASNPEIASEFGTSPTAVELAYIKRSTSTAAEAMAVANGEAPIAVTMLAAGMAGSQALGIDGGFHDALSSGASPGLLAAGDGGLSTRQRTELPA